MRGKPIWGREYSATGRIAHLARSRQTSHTFSDKTLVAYETFCGATIAVPSDDARRDDGVPVPLGAERCGSCIRKVDSLSDEVHAPLPTTVTETVVVTVTRPVTHKSLRASIEGMLGQAGRRQWQADVRSTDLLAADLARFGAETDISRPGD